MLNEILGQVPQSSEYLKFWLLVWCSTIDCAHLEAGEQTDISSDALTLLKLKLVLTSCWYQLEVSTDFSFKRVRASELLSVCSIALQ